MLFTSLLFCCAFFSGVFGLETEGLDNSYVLPEGKRRKFEYQFSFKGPHLMQSDGSIPFWKLDGVAAAGADKVRLVPSMRGMKGGIWSSYPFPQESWEVVVKFDIKGRTKMGADGMAFWYVDKELTSGDTFGSQGNFVGLGVFLDSFDNDGRGDNPFVTVFINDGTKSYDHNSDGTDQKLGGCRFNFRNNAYPAKLKIVYHQQTLKVFTSLGYTSDFHYELCSEVNDVNLPPNYYFGLSAATGAIADDHDVISFITSSILDVKVEDAQLTPEETQQQQEYEKNVEEFNKMHEEYKEQHPDQEEPSEAYEEIAGPELQALYDIQSNIHADVRSIHTLLVSLQTQQTSVTNLLHQIDARSSATTQQQVAPSGGDDNAKNYHIENVMNLQREVIDSISGLKSLLNTIQSSILAVSQQVDRSNMNQATGGGPGDQYLLQKLQQQLAGVQGDLHILSNKQHPTPQLRCPEPEMPQCTSIIAVVIIAVMQILILIIYHQIKSSREDAAKKFF